jgi:hypothetical protein
MSRGAEFGEVQTLNGRGGPIDARPTIRLPLESFGSGTEIDRAFIAQVTPLNSFRLGQQIFFWLGVQTPGQILEPGQNPVPLRARLKLWWARPNKEFRTPGDGGWLAIDSATFGNGPSYLTPNGPRADQTNNRYVWIPSPKRNDITPYQTAPPSPTPFPNSDSLLLDDCLLLDLPEPTDPTNIANFPFPQRVSRWASFFYPAMGYALGMTYDIIDPVTGASVPTLGNLTISLTWAVGTLGGTVYQESIG